MRGQIEKEQTKNIAWWLPENRGTEKRAEVCFRWLARIMSRQTVRRRMHLVNLRLYEDMPSIGLGPYTFTVYDPGDDTLRLNLVRAVVDTWVPLIGRSKPRPQAMTSDGDWTLKQRAKGLTTWFQGKWEEEQLYQQVSMPCLRDAAVFGMGCALTYRSFLDDKAHTDVCTERVFPWEIIADEVEAQNPAYLRTMARRRLVDRQQAADLFPADAGWILSQAPRYAPGSLTYDFAVDTASDLVAIVEFWRLPSTPTSKDGLHVIACPGRLLYEARWTDRRFPVSFLYRSRPSQGIWGVSIPTELRGMQVHINTSMVDIEECLRLYGKPKWMYQDGSVNPNFFSDAVDEAIPFAGQIPPTVYSPTVMPAETYAFLWQIWEKGFEQIGINQQRSQGAIPEGLSGSGASIRAWNDVEDGRLYEASSNFEQWHLEIARREIEIARSVAEIRPDYSTVVRGKTTVQIVKFADVDMDRDACYLDMMPVSRLATAPAQRQAQLQEWLNSGLIDQDAYRDLQDIPDLEGETNLLSSPRRLADKLITQFLEADEPDDPDVWVAPEPEWPLAMMKARFQFAEIQARLDGCPEANVRLLRNWIKLADNLAAKAVQPPAPAAAGAPPGAAPGASAGPNAPQLPPMPPPLPSTLPGQAAA